jgi:hypothetical protein
LAEVETPDPNHYLLSLSVFFFFFLFIIIFGSNLAVRMANSGRGLDDGQPPPW